MNPFTEGTWNNRGSHTVGITGEVNILNFTSRFLIVSCTTSPHNPAYSRGGHLIVSFFSVLGTVESTSHPLILRTKKLIILPESIPTPYDILVVSMRHLSNLSINIWEHSVNS